MSDEWYEARWNPRFDAGVNAHNMFRFCTIAYSQKAVESDLVSLNIQIPLKRFQATSDFQATSPVTEQKVDGALDDVLISSEDDEQKQREPHENSPPEVASSLNTELMISDSVAEDSGAGSPDLDFLLSKIAALQDKISARKAELPMTETEKRDFRRRIIREQLKLWDFNDSLIDEVITMEEAIDLGDWHRVCLKMMVREKKSLQSQTLLTLDKGRMVNVVEIVGGRARINIKGLDGWCSIRSRLGDLILSRLNGEQTPFGKKHNNFWRSNSDSEDSMEALYRISAENRQRNYGAE